MTRRPASDQARQRLVEAAVAQLAQEGMRGLPLARYELVLHVARRPGLQEILRAARDEFVSRTAAALPVPNPEAGARMVIAFVDGLALHQISAHEPSVDTMAPPMLLATSAAAMHLPAPGALP